MTAPIVTGFRAVGRPMDCGDVVANYAKRGKTQEATAKYYTIDEIIMVGYRLKSHQVTQFSIWATQRFKEYIVKGFAFEVLAQSIDKTL